MMPYQFRTKANIIDSQDFQSSVITSLRFPLIVMIIMFHLYEPGAVIDDSSMLHYSLAKIFGADGIAKIAVPTFFMISGYLFFFNIKKWDILEYRRKLKSRVSSLLIPYLLWNAIPIIGGILLNIFIAIAHGMPLFAQAKEFLHSIGWLNAFWNVSDGHPYVVPLWYIRDLMICCLFTPLIYFFIDSKIGCFYLLIIGICFLTDFWFDVPGFSIRALFFFSIGAYFGIKKLNIVNTLSKIRMPIYVVTFLLLITTVFWPETFGEYHLLACNIFIMFGIWTLFNIVAFVKVNFSLQIPVILTESVFFIFAFHVFPLPRIGSVLAGGQFVISKISIHNETISGLIEVVLSPMLIILICVFVYSVFRYMTPHLCNVINGSRMHK